MKKIYYLFIIFSTIALAQNNYKKIYKPNQHIPQLTMVKSITGNYGFIDNNGKEIVPAVYQKIYPFGKIHPKWAQVKSIAGNLGFIDQTGKVIVDPIYKNIYPFSKHKKNWALVQTIHDFYGFIDKSGKIVVKPLFTLSEIKEECKKAEKNNGENNIKNQKSI